MAIFPVATSRVLINWDRWEEHILVAPINDTIKSGLMEGVKLG